MLSISWDDDVHTWRRKWKHKNKHYSGFMNQKEMGLIYMHSHSGKITFSRSYVCTFLPWLSWMRKCRLRYL